MMTVDYFVEAREASGEWGITGASLTSLHDGLAELNKLHELFPARELRLTRRSVSIMLNTVACAGEDSLVIMTMP